MTDPLFIFYEKQEFFNPPPVKHPEFLQPYKDILIEEVAQINQQEVRWHVAQMFSRLELNGDDRKAVLEILLGYLQDESKIVKTFSMQALADLAVGDVNLRPQVIDLLKEITGTGSPAMKSRGRKLLEKLKP